MNEYFVLSCLLSLLNHKNNIKLLIFKRNLYEIYRNSLSIIAANTNNLPLLTYVYDNDYKMDINTICAAVNNDNFDIIAFMFQHGCIKDIYEKFLQDITTILDESRVL